MMDHLGSAKRPTLPEPHYWHQCVRLLVAAFVVTLAVLLWVLAFQMSGSARSASADTESDWTGKRCSWGRCKETARLLKSLRSNHTSPCVDFYEHVCAGVHGTSELSVGSANLIVMRQLAAAATASIVRHALVRGPPRLQQTAGEKASAFLKMCKARALRHEDNLSALRSYVQASGLLDEDSSFNPLVKTCEYLFVLGLPVFYQTGIDDALVWRRRRLLTVEISTVTELWLKAQRAFSDQVSYTKYVLGVLQAAGVEAGRADALSFTIADLEDIVDATYHQYLVEKSNNSRILVMRLEEQASLFSNDTQIKQEWSEFVVENVTMGYSSPVHVLIGAAAANFFKNIVDKLEHAELRTLIAWEVIRDIVIASGVVPLVGHYTQWYCVQKTLHVYGHGLTVPYFHSFVTSKVLREITTMYVNIKYYMTKAVNTSWWLRGSSRNATMQIIRRLKTRIIFPHTLESKNSLDEHHANCPDVRCPFLSTYLKATRARAKHLIALATSLSTRVSYSDPRKFVAMAVYNRKTHALFLSGSSTFAPALDTKGPVEVNYGLFGRIVAQAIVRALASFTDEAPSSSRQSQVWTNDTGRSLRDLALCLGKQADELEESSAQYSQRFNRFRSAASTTARGESSPVPGPVVLEALGLAPLYEAYTDAIKYDVPRQPLVLPGLEDLSEERLFFFAWCYSLCSGERKPKGRALASLRCNLAVANQAAFVKAFACDPGLPMNPAVKCPLW